jgi:hypothetical protein
MFRLKRSMRLEGYFLPCLNRNGLQTSLLNNPESQWSINHATYKGNRCSMGAVNEAAVKLVR